MVKLPKELQDKKKKVHFTKIKVIPKEFLQCKNISKSLTIKLFSTKLYRCKIMEKKGINLLCTGFKPFPKKCPMR